MIDYYEKLVVQYFNKSNSIDFLKIEIFYFIYLDLYRIYQ
jgi:hypothetical protein